MKNQVFSIRAFLYYLILAEEFAQIHTRRFAQFHTASYWLKNSHKFILCLEIHRFAQIHTQGFAQNQLPRLQEYFTLFCINNSKQCL